LSSVDVDGSHTPAIRGGEEAGYQGRKKRKTTNAHYLTNRQDLVLAISGPVSGNHNDLYNIEVQFEEITSTLEEADIAVKGLFLNADAGFDPKSSASVVRKKKYMPIAALTGATAVKQTERNILTRNCMIKDTVLKEPTPG